VNRRPTETLGAEYAAQKESSLGGGWIEKVEASRGPGVTPEGETGGGTYVHSCFINATIEKREFTEPQISVREKNEYDTRAVRTGKTPGGWGSAKKPQGRAIVATSI